MSQFDVFENPIARARRAYPYVVTGDNRALASHSPGDRTADCFK